MIPKLRRLLKIKDMKEQEALRLLQAKRRALSAVERELEQAVADCAESARTYPEREEAVYDQIMRRVVDQGEIDDMKGDLVKLEQAHQEFVDAVTRMRHVVERTRNEVEAAKRSHATTIRVRDKYIHLVATAVAEKTAEDDAREENEIEELFAKPMKKITEAAAHGA